MRYSPAAGRRSAAHFLLLFIIIILFFKIFLLLFIAAERVHRGTDPGESDRGFCVCEQETHGVSVPRRRRTAFLFHPPSPEKTGARGPPSPALSERLVVATQPTVSHFLPQSMGSARGDHAVLEVAQPLLVRHVSVAQLGPPATRRRGAFLASRRSARAEISKNTPKLP